MGASNTSEKIYERGFDQVDSKCDWRVGLTVNVRGQPLLKVANIRPINSTHPRLRVKGDNYIYIYRGSRVDGVGRAHNHYEITLTPVGKMGAAESAEESSEVESTVDDSNDSNDSNDISALDFTKGKFRIRVAPCSRLKDNVL